MEWQVFHRYNKLVDRGKANSIECSACGNDLQLVMGKNDDPAYKCFYCDSLLYPGLSMYEKIKAVVDEWYGDFNV